MGVATGCGCKAVYRFPHTTYPYSSCICSFLQQHPYFFVHVFRSCSSTFLNYILCITFFFTQYKHTYRQLRASHGIHMKVAHTVLYMKKHTQTYASYPAMDISCMSVVSLEVEGVRYIEMHRGPAAYVLGPPPSRGRDLELEGGVNACHVESNTYVYEYRDSHVRGTE